MLEIDLLREGKHTAAVPQPVFRPEHRYDYPACPHRAGTQDYEVWFNMLSQHLPLVLVLLDAGVPDVVLDLTA